MYQSIACLKQCQDNALVAPSSGLIQTDVIGAEHTSLLSDAAGNKGTLDSFSPQSQNVLEAEQQHQVVATYGHLAPQRIDRGFHLGMILVVSLSRFLDISANEDIICLEIFTILL